MKADILGVKIDDVSLTEALTQIEKWIWNPGKHFIVTPNPEIIVAAQKDNRLKSILNDADLSIPDGAGLKLSGKIKNTTNGTDLMERLIKLSADKGFIVGFLGGKDEVAKKCAERLLQEYPNLKVSFAGPGGEVDNNGQVKEQDLRFMIYDSRSRENHKSLFVNHKSLPPTDILFVAFGHIKQEKWIACSLDKIPAKVAIGVGGAFDYLSKTVPRAPTWLRSLGLEWLFRLTIQPWRFKRQVALIEYLWLLSRKDKIC